MQWQAIHIQTQSSAVDAISDLLTVLGAQGVEIQDSQDSQTFEPSNTGVLLDWQKVPHREEGAEITAYFPSDDALNVAELTQQVNALSQFGLDVSPGIVTATQLADEDWENNWKQYYQAVRLTRHFTVVPAWMDFEAQQSDELPLVLDPGMAFGTGTHETTKLMLQALEIVVRGQERMLDVGTGSGILSIAAKHLGVDHIIATDIDEMAVRVAQENLALNPVAQNIDVQVSDLLHDVALNEPVDLIVANILADVIALLIPQTVSRLRPGGYFLVSGIIRQNAPAIEQQLKNAGYHIEQILNMGDWFAYIARRPEEN
jgi:ribosomal protein L11 methyltransferase